MGKKYYITGAIPYTNSRPHVGHALEFVQGDTIARYHKLLGEDVVLLSGGDENALKNVQAAEKEGEPIQEFVDKNNKLFVELTKNLNCDFDIWQKEVIKSIILNLHKNSGNCATKTAIFIKKNTGVFIVLVVKLFILPMN